MCKHCGYRPELHETVQRIIIFQDHDEHGNPILRVHTESGSLGDEGFRKFPGIQYISAGSKVSEIADWMIQLGAHRELEDSGIADVVETALNRFFNPEEVN